MEHLIICFILNLLYFFIMFAVRVSCCFDSTFTDESGEEIEVENWTSEFALEVYDFFDDLVVINLDIAFVWFIMYMIGGSAWI